MVWLVGWGICVLGWFDIVFMVLNHEDDTGLGTARLYCILQVLFCGGVFVIWGVVWRG